MAPLTQHPASSCGNCISCSTSFSHLTCLFDMGARRLHFSMLRLLHLLEIHLLSFREKVEKGEDISPDLLRPEAMDQVCGMWYVQIYLWRVHFDFPPLPCMVVYQTTDSINYLMLMHRRALQCARFLLVVLRRGRVECVCQTQDL